MGGRGTNTLPQDALKQCSRGTVRSSATYSSLAPHAARSGAELATARCVDRALTLVILRLPKASAISVGSTPCLNGGSRYGCLSFSCSDAKLRVACPRANGLRVCIAPSVLSEPLAIPLGAGGARGG